jgi:hypothetical protein
LGLWYEESADSSQQYLFNSGIFVFNCFFKKKKKKLSFKGGLFPAPLPPSDETEEDDMTEFLKSSRTKRVSQTITDYDEAIQRGNCFNTFIFVCIIN